MSAPFAVTYLEESRRLLDELVVLPFRQQEARGTAQEEEDGRHGHAGHHENVHGCTPGKVMPSIPEARPH